MRSQFESISSVLLSRGHPSDVALLDRGTRYTYSDLRGAVATQVGRIAEWDLPHGSRIGLLGGNSFFWVVSYLAVMHAGHTVVPLASTLTPDDVLRKTGHVGCDALLVDERLRGRFRPVLREMSRVITSDGLDAVSGGGTHPLQPAQPPASDAVLMFTSGTTSRPRAVRVSHENLKANTASIIEYLGLRRDDRMLVVLPFSYCFGASLLHTHLAVGGSLRLCETQAFPETIVEAIAADNCTGLAGVPSSYQLLLRASSYESRSLPSLRLQQQAGGRLPYAQIERVVAAQPQAQLFVMYGQTEATARLAYLPPEFIARKRGSAGKAIPGVRLRITDEAGAGVPAGTVGEIRAQGENITQGYWEDPDGTAKKFVNGELCTGDLGRMDEDGFLYIVDRRDDFIKSWGYRISSHEIEDAVLEMPEIAAAAAVGRPDSDAGEAVVLFVSLASSSGLNADEILRYARSRLAKHLVPQEIHIVRDLPLNENGKVVKSKLRQQAEEHSPDTAGS